MGIRALNYNVLLIYMSKIFYINLDLNRNELQNAVLHPRGDAPSNGVEGQIYYNTNNDKIYYYNGSDWVAVATASELGVTSFGVSGSPQTGDITVGNGLQMNSKEVSVKAKSSDYVKVGGNGVQLDSTKIDSTYTTADATNLATVASVTAAIGNLDTSADVQAVEYTAASGNDGAKLTFKGVSETNGVIAQGNGDAELQFAKVATSGSAADVSVISGTYGGTTIVTTTQGALDNLTSAISIDNRGFKATTKNLSFTGSTATKTATITVTGCATIDKNIAIVEVRNENNEVVDCHIDYEYNVITITANNPPTGMYAVVHYPSSYTIS